MELLSTPTEGLWFQSPGKVEIKPEFLPPPAGNQVRVKSLMSLISSGTELLFFQGMVPESHRSDLTLSTLGNLGTYPLSYGYSVVGDVIGTGSEITRLRPGDRVFCFHPHWSNFNCPVGELWPLPLDMTPEDGIFLAQMETALSLVLDLAPLVGEKIKVFGLGTVGLLAALVLKNFPLEVLGVEDPREDRSQRAGAEGLNLGEVGPWDGVLEISGSPSAFNKAVEELAFSGRLVAGSWYGDRPGVNLGGSFHRKRLKVLSSQVSCLDPRISGLWDKDRLRTLALKWLGVLRPSRFITHRFPLSQGQAAYDMLQDPFQSFGALVFDYSLG